MLYLSLEDKKIMLCLEYIDNDLRKLWDKSYCGESNKSKKVDLKIVKSVMYQILKGIDFLHSKKILHRDLKPQNVLIDSQLRVKIADFGLSRSYTIPIKKYTKEVLTLWYRAPELIIGTEYYSTGIDMWSIGCIFGELLYKKPLFQGDSEISQLLKIYETLGSPSEESLPGYKTFPYFDEKLPYWEKGIGLATKLKDTGVTSEALDLLTQMFVYNPSKRISCKEALNHPFFKNVIDPNSNCNNNSNSN